MTYQPGDRVALVYTDDAYTHLQPGDEGTVSSYNEQLQQLEVDWDSGSKLSMWFGDGDRVRKL
ncbi:DUF4314 domain-containing protein [Streptomyces sp. MP131-18]|uniref:DUF4314 domain-containing protein n=1 Tax=Streptomyces sp. MP131-18 TaxID=1857892 RepID=UPI00097C1440|nr:DUF4314 domain-containing protein [Streptomyces sp. MP131-18]ONK13252.1 hypothetical protein STBA_40150 [Streptomyces sp. MP131-18]